MKPQLFIYGGSRERDKEHWVKYRNKKNKFSLILFYVTYLVVQKGHVIHAKCIYESEKITSLCILPSGRCN